MEALPGPVPTCVQTAPNPRHRGSCFTPHHPPPLPKAAAPVLLGTATRDPSVPAATSLSHYKRRKIPQTTPPKPSPPSGRSAASGPASQAGRARAARRAVQHWKQLLHYPAGLQRGPAALQTPDEERAATSSWETVAFIQTCTSPLLSPPPPTPFQATRLLGIRVGCKANLPCAGGCRHSPSCTSASPSSAARCCERKRRREAGRSGYTQRL